MKRLLPLLLLATAALAQPTEHVTVTGTKSREAISGFVQSFASPVRMTGKMARWGVGICPVTIGLPAAFGHYVIDHLKDVAAKAGTPVNTDLHCSPNIQIVFAQRAQVLLDQVRARAPDLLGYLDNDSLRAEAATLHRPIQAWYMTDTVDVRGQRFTDSSTHGGGLSITVSPNLPPIFYPHAHATAVTGSRLGDGLRSEFHHVLVVADAMALQDYEMGAVADYIALLALSQPDRPGACQQLSSIVNLFATDCAPVAALTDTDRAWLAGLYRMGPDRTLRTQQDEVAYQMEQSLAGK